jgi:hypothetical protein
MGTKGVFFQSNIFVRFAKGVLQNTKFYHHANSRSWVCMFAKSALFNTLCNIFFKETFMICQPQNKIINNSIEYNYGNEKKIICNLKCVHSCVPRQEHQGTYVKEWCNSTCTIFVSIYGLYSLCSQLLHIMGLVKIKFHKIWPNIYKNISVFIL